MNRARPQGLWLASDSALVANPPRRRRGPTSPHDDHSAGCPHYADTDGEWVPKGRIHVSAEVQRSPLRMKTTSTPLMHPPDSSADDTPRENHPDGTCRRSDAASVPNARRRIFWNDELPPRLAFESHHGPTPGHYWPGPRAADLGGASLRVPSAGNQQRVIRHPQVRVSRQAGVLLLCRYCA
jgi:hypothetical protein